MKKITTCFIIFSIIISCISGCSGKKASDTLDTTESTYKEKDNTASDEKDNDNNDAEVIKTIDIITEEDAYHSYLEGELPLIIDGEESYFNEEDYNEDAFIPTYAITDIDEDMKNELIVNRYGYWPLVLFFDGEKLFDMGLEVPSSYAKTYFTSDGIAIFEDTGHAGRYSYEIFKVNDNKKFQYLKTLSHWYPSEYTDLTEDEYLLDEATADENIDNTIDRHEYADTLLNYFLGIKNIDYTICPGYGDSVVVTDTSRRFKSAGIEDFLYYYSVDSEMEGSITGEASAYHNIVLSKELQDIDIVRGITGEGSQYSFYNNGEHLFTTRPMDNPPNSFQAIGFADVNMDGTAEVLVNNYIGSTGGMILTSGEMFELKNGNWERTLLFGYEKSENDQGLIDYVHVFEFGEVKDIIVNKDPSFSVRDILILNNQIRYLVDFGMKDGAEQYFDYYCVIQFMDGGAPDISKEAAEVSWPFDVMY